MPTPNVNQFNAINRGVYIDDNLDFLRKVSDHSVDLVCIDPPFAKFDTFTAKKLKPPLTQAEAENENRLLRSWGISTPEQADAAGIAWPDDPKSRGGYDDTWHWDADIHKDWVTGIGLVNKPVRAHIEAAMLTHGDSLAAYLSFMAIRLFEIHRVLKPTGSLYMHCDHSANSYLRQLLDGVFGKDNFRREIIWTLPRPSGYKTTAKNWIRQHETIFYYTKSDSALFNKQYEPYPEEYLKHFNKEDEEGKYWWRDGRKRRIGEGFSRGDVWTDIHSMQTQSVSRKEGTGYPTQKPVALAERIILSSTNPGDVVLDCFAGCAYVAIAAERLGRRWTACDINIRAWTVFKRQFDKPDLALLDMDDSDFTIGQRVMPIDSIEKSIPRGPNQLPQLKQGGAVSVKKPSRTDNRKQYKRESVLFKREEMLEVLLHFSDGRAWCCGEKSENLDGSLAYGNYELDHIVPRVEFLKQGFWDGLDDIENRAPLCSEHNGLKGGRDITLVELRYEVIDRGELKVPVQSLVKLSAAYEYAISKKAEAYKLRYNPQPGLPENQN